MYAEYSYGMYLIISIVLTIWVAQTLFKHGRIFLVAAFGGDEKLADSINHLLVVGFYLVNVGYVSLMLKEDRPPVDLKESIEKLSWKIGLVLLILGGMHFFNLMVFSKMRRNAIDGQKAGLVSERVGSTATMAALKEVKANAVK